MVVRLQTVAMSYVRMMRAFLVVARLMMFGGSAVMLGRVFMMLRGFMMMFDVVFGHGILSCKRIVRLREFPITKT